MGVGWGRKFHSWIGKVLLAQTSFVFGAGGRGRGADFGCVCEAGVCVAHVDEPYHNAGHP